MRGKRGNGILICLGDDSPLPDIYSIGKEGRGERGCAGGGAKGQVVWELPRTASSECQQGAVRMQRCRDPHDGQRRRRRRRRREY